MPVKLLAAKQGNPHLADLTGKSSQCSYFVAGLRSLQGKAQT